MVDIDYDNRPVRLCMACGKRDRAPRDVIALSDGNVALYHMDCHAMLGCGVCAEVVRVAKKAKDEKLVEFLASDESDKHEVFTTDDAAGKFGGV